MNTTTRNSEDISTPTLASTPNSMWMSTTAPVLCLPFPPSANRYWRKGKGRVYRSDEASRYIAEAGWSAKRDGAELLEGEVGMQMHLYFGRHQGDTSNRIKVLEDALQGICYLDDKQVSLLFVRRFYDKLHPRVELRVWPMYPEWL